MSNKLYVGNLPHDVTEEELIENFDDIGKCISAKVIRDRVTGISKGFAFVEMSTEEEAREAIRKCKGVEFDGRKLIVNEAKPKKVKSADKPGGKNK